MKRLLFITLSIASFSVQAQIPTNNLLGHYKFDGNLLDNSGNNNDITVGTGTFVSDRFENSNAALSLNGTTDSLVIPINEFAPISGDFTISFWYKTNSPKVMNLLSSKQFASDTTSNFEIQLSSNDAFSLEFITQNYYTTYAYWNGTGVNQNAFGEGTAGAFTKGEWCHFVITREADTLSVFRNHSLSYMGINNFYGGSLGDAVDLVFSANPYLFKGVIDDMRLYNRNLNQAEIDLLWFENRPFVFQQVKSTDAYVKGSNLLVTWEYDLSQISDSILVETSINGGPFSPIVHSNNYWESYTYLDMNLPAGTTIELKVSDFTNPLLTNSTGKLTVSPYDWIEIQDTLPFHAMDGSGAVVFQNKMWLLGGWDPPYHAPTNTHSNIWNSSDGINWDSITTAPWPARHAAAWLVGNDAMWVIGGDPQSGCLTDVWKSEDGINWIETNHAIPGYVSRNNPNYAFINGKLTIYGGEQCSGEPLNEVWTSADGITWTQEQNAPWEGRGMQINSCIDGSGQMWMLGGSSEGTRRSYNEVWKSADGINWTLVNESAPWAGRYWHTVSYFDNKMWLFAGMATGTEMNDVWYSEDGITWKELKSTTGNWPAATRHAQSGTTYDNAVWYMCGINTNNAWKIVNTATLGMEEKVNSRVDISIFPNPNNGNFTIESKNKFNNESLTVLDFSGRTVLSQKLTNGLSKEKISLSNLAKGVYFVHLSNNENKVFVEKIVIQ